MAFISYDQYIPNNDFNPIDLNIKGLSGIAAKTQADYESNFLKLSALKQGYLNIDLLNQEDKDQLNKYNGVIGDWFANNKNANFSDSRTIESITKLFQPISSNPDLLAGAKTTSLFKQGQALIEQSKKDKTYSSTSHANFMHDMQEYMNAKGNDKRNWSPRPYVPNCDYSKRFTEVASKLKPNSDIIDPTNNPDWINQGGAIMATQNDLSKQRVFNAIAGSADDCFQNQMRERAYYNSINNPKFNEELYNSKLAFSDVEKNNIQNNINQVQSRINLEKNLGRGENTPEMLQYKQQLDDLQSQLSLTETNSANLRTPEGRLNYLNRNRNELVNEATELLGFQTIDNIANGFAYNNTTGARFVNNRIQEITLRNENMLKLAAMKAASSNNKKQVGTNPDGTPIFEGGVDDNVSTITQNGDYNQFVEEQRSSNIAWNDAANEAYIELGITGTNIVDKHQKLQEVVNRYKSGEVFPPSVVDKIQRYLSIRQVAITDNNILEQAQNEALNRVNILAKQQNKNFKTVNDLVKGSNINIEYNSIAPTTFKSVNDETGILYYLNKQGINLNNMTVPGALPGQPRVGILDVAKNNNGNLSLWPTQSREFQDFLNTPENREKAAMAYVEYNSKNQGANPDLLSKNIPGSYTPQYYKELQSIFNGMTTMSKNYKALNVGHKPEEIRQVTQEVRNVFHDKWRIKDDDGNVVDITPEEIEPQSWTKDFVTLRVSLPKVDIKSQKEYKLETDNTENNRLYPSKSIKNDGNSVLVNVPMSEALYKYIDPSKLSTGAIQNLSKKWEQAYKLDGSLNYEEVFKNNLGQTFNLKVDPRFRDTKNKTSGLIYNYSINGMDVEQYFRNIIAKTGNTNPNLIIAIQNSLTKLYSDNNPDYTLQGIKQLLLNLQSN